MTKLLGVIVLTLVLASCSNGDAPANDAGTGSDASPTDAADLDATTPPDAVPPDPTTDAGPEDCEGIWVGRVTGQFLDITGAPPTLPAVVTICGNACLYRDVAADGTFNGELDFCFGTGDPLPRPVVVYHGLKRYSDLHIDFMGPGVARIDRFDFADPIYVAPRSLMAAVTVEPSAAQTLSDGAGFALSWEARAVTLPFGREEIAVLRMPDDRMPPISGAEDLVSLYAVLSDETVFSPPASVVFPNEAGLAAGTSVEVVGIGNLATHDPYAGTIGHVADAHVSDDGATIELDDGEGIRVLGWLGLRSLE